MSNLRRRPIRTALTCVTLIILTFTIMNFTAVKSVQQSGWSSFDDSASYKGLFMKAFNWLDLPPKPCRWCAPCSATRAWWRRASGSR